MAHERARQGDACDCPILSPPPSSNHLARVVRAAVLTRTTSSAPRGAAVTNLAPWRTPRLRSRVVPEDSRPRYYASLGPTWKVRQRQGDRTHDAGLPGLRLLQRANLFTIRVLKTVGGRGRGRPGGPLGHAFIRLRRREHDAPHPASERWLRWETWPTRLASRLRENLSRAERGRPVRPVSLQRGPSGGRRLNGSRCFVLRLPDAPE